MFKTTSLFVYSSSILAILSLSNNTYGSDLILQEDLEREKIQIQQNIPPVLESDHTETPSVSWGGWLSSWFYTTKEEKEQPSREELLDELSGIKLTESLVQDFKNKADSHISLSDYFRDSQILQRKDGSSTLKIGKNQVTLYEDAIYTITFIGDITGHDLLARLNRGPLKASSILKSVANKEGLIVWQHD